MSREPSSDARTIQGDGPWYLELKEFRSPVDALAQVIDHRLPILLESASTASSLGRYSFLAFDPLVDWRVNTGESQPLKALQQSLHSHVTKSVAELPPFQGGIAGLWSYDLGRSFERIPAARYDEFEVPAIAAGLYDTVVSWDHQQQRAWIVSHGLDSSLKPSRTSAEHSIERVLGILKRTSKTQAVGEPIALASRAELIDAFPMSQWPNVWSNFSREGFLQAIRAGIEAIRAGDIFQVNLAHRLASPVTDSAFDLYRRLRERNAAPFAGYFDTGHETIVSASPERLFQLRGGRVESRPIKGTAMRSWFPESDFAAAANLQASRKDRAENVMIVDLLRNDLSRVCEQDSIQVTQLCAIEKYQFVQHLVSAIEGRLVQGRDALDVIEAIFPGGSITGAPKIRAMELIAEIEPTARGAYCGSLGYIGFDGEADLSILIRTVTQSRGWWTFPVGGGMVIGSDPESEYQETWHKARGLLASLAR